MTHKSFPGKMRSFKNKSYIPNSSRIERDGEHLIIFVKFSTIFCTGVIYFVFGAYHVYVVVNKRSFPGKTISFKNKSYILSRINRDGEHLTIFVKFGTTFCTGVIYFVYGLYYGLCCCEQTEFSWKKNRQGWRAIN